MKLLKFSYLCFVCYNDAMITQLFAENILEIFLLAIGASFVQRTTGFGFGIFIMTLLPFLMPSYGEATALSTIWV